MKKHILVVAALLLSLVATAAQAAVEWSVVQEFKAPAAFVDAAVSPDGRNTFVLTKNNGVQVFSATGALKGTIPAGPGVDRIALSEDGQVLHLLNSKSGSIRLLAVTFQVALDATGSPFKGKDNAPVVLTEFSDFQ